MRVTLTKKKAHIYPLVLFGTQSSTILIVVSSKTAAHYSLQIQPSIAWRRYDAISK